MTLLIWVEATLQHEGISTVESVWLPAAAALGAVLGAAVADGWMPQRLALLVGVAVAVAPSWLALLASPFGAGTAARLAFVEVGLVFIWTRTRGRAGRTTATAFAALTPVWVWTSGSVDQAWFEPELVIVPLVAAGAWIVGTATQRWDRVWWWALVAVGAASTATAVATGRVPAESSLEVARVVLLEVGWVAGAVLTSRPAARAWFGTIAVALAWAQVVAPGDPGSPIESWSLPTALALAIIGWLSRSARSTPMSTLLWVGPAVGMALLPTAWTLLSEGDVGPRFVAGLLVSAAVLVVGVQLRWAGMVVPALVSLALLVLPVLLGFARELPAWLPLSLVGLALLIVGARWEATRRETRRLTDWAVRLH